MRLVFVSAMYASEHDGGVYFHPSLGRVLEHLSSRVDHLSVTVPIVRDGTDSTRSFRLSGDNVEYVAQPAYRSSIGGLKKGLGVARAYWSALQGANCVIVRGMVPWLELLYLYCLVLRVVPVHWLVGDPQALLASHRRSSWGMDTLAWLFAGYQSVLTKVGHAITRGAYLCNGEAISRRYPSPRSWTTVSSTIEADEIHFRGDAFSRAHELRILFVGFIRPEKGIEYLLQAVAMLPPSVRWHLEIVGDVFGRGDYRDRLVEMARDLRIEDRTSWVGYVDYGAGLETKMREADALVLPSLSEGTPRVLIEARANGTPVVATCVGGVPSSVESGVDGILVPARDAAAIRDALVYLVDHPEETEAMIGEGYRTARKYTVEALADIMIRICREVSNGN